MSMSRYDVQTLEKRRLTCNENYSNNNQILLYKFNVFRLTIKFI